MKNICNGCGGIIGRDCFNHIECEYITNQMQGECDYESVKQDNEKLNKLLYELTPGGSEFVNDPEYCALFAKEQINSVPSVIMPFKRENEKLKEENKMLLEALKRAAQIMESYNLMKSMAGAEIEVAIKKAERK
jgi:hypothetical protein